VVDDPGLQSADRPDYQQQPGQHLSSEQRLQQPDLRFNTLALGDTMSAAKPAMKMIDF